jgi:hypothetical protein
VERSNLGGTAEYPSVPYGMEGFLLEITLKVEGAGCPVAELHYGTH